MAIEIEHKFLLRDPSWRDAVYQSVIYKQGYLCSSEKNSVRVRISDKQAWLNIKSAVIGISRHEYEYMIPLQEAHEMLENLCNKPLIEKTRHFVKNGQHIWEIDEFSGENEGLIVAEIELSEHDEAFQKPRWVGKEVTHDLRYYNNNLCHHPYKEWNEKL